MRPHVAATLGLVLYVLYLLLALGARSLLQYHRTGSTGFHGIRGHPGSLEWFGGVLFVVALVLGALAPAAQVAALVKPISALDRPGAQLLGLALFACGLGATLTAQLAMGSAWRIGVDPEERTSLVTSGPFRWVRNPIFSAMAVEAVGLSLLVPNLVTLLAAAALLAALQIQVRWVEEPYLQRTHGRAYAAYAARVGRFVPGLGRQVAAH